MHLQLGEIHFIIISSVDLAKQVVRTHDINFANRPPGLTCIIQECLQLATGFMLADLYPSISLLPLITGAQLKTQQMYHKLDKLLDSIIEQHKAAREGGEAEDLVDVLLKIQQHGTEFPLTTQNIKAVILVSASNSL